MRKTARNLAPYLIALLGTGLLTLAIRRPPIEPTKPIQIALAMVLVLCVGAGLVVVARQPADRSDAAHTLDAELPFSDDERQRLAALRKAQQRQQRR